MALRPNKASILVFLRKRQERRMRAMRAARLDYDGRRLSEREVQASERRWDALQHEVEDDHG